MWSRDRTNTHILTHKPSKPSKQPFTLQSIVKMLAFVPSSVRRCRDGFVRNPAAGWSLNIPQWIPAPKKSTPVDMVAVDRVVDVLSRFVARWVAQSREMRRVARIREAGERWTRYAMQPNWALMTERAEIREREFARRERMRFVAMSDADWRAYCRAEIAAARDLGPLMAAWVPINAMRDANAAARREQERVWQEISRAGLHNSQRSAPVRVSRVVVNRGRFAALDGSDSE